MKIALAIAVLAFAVPAFALALSTPAAAANHGSTYISNVFKDGPKGEKIHIASGFTCPDRIGRYIRDAVGESDLLTGSDFCSYYALDGVYGTVTLTPLSGDYKPVQSLHSAFVEQEGMGGKEVNEKTIALGPKDKALQVYTRTFETAHLETLHYRITFTGADIGHWVVETTVEYAEPRDDAVKQAFLDWVYGAALKEIAGSK